MPVASSFRTRLSTLRWSWFNFFLFCVVRLIELNLEGSVMTTKRDKSRQVDWTLKQSYKKFSILGSLVLPLCSSSCMSCFIGRNSSIPNPVSMYLRSSAVPYFLLAFTLILWPQLFFNEEQEELDSRKYVWLKIAADVLMRACSSLNDGSSWIDGNDKRLMNAQGTAEILMKKRWFSHRAVHVIRELGSDIRSLLLAVSAL